MNKIYILSDETILDLSDPNSDNADGLMAKILKILNMPLFGTGPVDTSNNLLVRDPIKEYVDRVIENNYKN